jgi:hypothetical protein
MVPSISGKMDKMMGWKIRIKDTPDVQQPQKGEEQRRQDEGRFLPFAED